MKCLFMLVLVTATQAFVLREKRGAEEVPAPKLTSIASYDNSSFAVELAPVESPDSSDPVVGYKVKLWKPPLISLFSHKQIDGQEKFVEEKIPGTLSMNKIPVIDPMAVITVGSDTTRVRVENMERGIAYQVRVLAFTKKRESPLSPAFELLQHKKDD